MFAPSEVSMRLRSLFLPVLACALLAGPAAAQSSAAEHEASDHVVTNPDDGTEIAITVFKPAGASTNSQVPVILHSHGWGGSRQTTVSGAVQEFLDAGFGVVSIDQRGHGESSGEATVQDPTKETEDIKAVIDFVAGLNWVKRDKGRANDPVLGAIGGSYGGGYQTMTALDEIADEGRTRFNALAPEITWYDLPESLAPQKVVRSAWNTLLYGVGAPMLPQYVHEAFAWGSTTGLWPDGTVYGEKVDGVPDLDSEFHKHSPVAFVEKGIRINVPVLLRQGTSDNLFNLNEGLDIFQKAVTSKARKNSYFVAYNGGHALPNVLPPGTSAGSDACSPDGSFTQLTIDFFKRTLSGASTKGLLPSRYNLTTAAGDKCLHLDSLDSSDPIAVDPLGTGSTISTAGVGAPLNFAIAEGPITLAGIPKLTGTATTTALDSRSFFGLSVGTSPADARVLQNNVMPLRKILPGQDEKFEIRLPGVVAEVPEGQSLFLTVSPISDMSFEHGSRVPGAVVLNGVELTLPEAATGKRR
jgi:ABC-2 type transport system ATP-binding protein